MSIKQKVILPFTIKKSEVSGGYVTQLHTEFLPGTEITDYHTDQYRIGEEEVFYISTPLQSPFTEGWVGGRSHRHVELNRGSDDSKTRPEAFHVQLLSNSVRLRSHRYLQSPPAYWTREGHSKKSVNFSNLKTELSSLRIGNYQKNYEIVQTSGRRITNNLIVDGFQATGVLTTQFITSSNGNTTFVPRYLLPDLNNITGSKSVIVERFNAPGSKEESSRSSLDREGEEMSPNIPLPFRNIKIRQPFYRQLTQHSPQFGSGLTYALLPSTGSLNTVSLHKNNRNRLVRAGREYYDNWFVTNALPRTDIQYSWITASSTTTAAELGGYQSYGDPYGTGSLYDKSGAYRDIRFNTGSLVSSGSNLQFYVDSNFITSLIKDSKNIDTNTNTLIAAASLSASFSEFCNSNYTFTTWTSLRKGDSPVARALRKNSIVSIIETPKPKSFKSLTGQLISFTPTRGDKIINYYDPPVTFKYKPLIHSITYENPDSNNILELKYDYSNAVSTFANKELIKKLNITEDVSTFYNLLRNKYRRSFVTSVFYQGHKYSEIVWPREENTARTQTRKRSEYYLDTPGHTRDGYDIQLGTQRVFWREEQQERKRSAVSSGGYSSSLGFSSTEEVGTSYSQNENVEFIDGNQYNISSSFIRKSGYDSGLFNSISILEPISSEREIYSFVAKVSGSTRVHNNINKRGYIFDVSGEFNNLFIDSYEQENRENENIDPNNTILSADTKRSIGVLYRNTSYKSLLTSLRSEELGYSIKTTKIDDERLSINPKLKYVAFIGGLELNTGSFVQNTSSFSSTTTGSNSTNFSLDYFNQTFAENDFLFSTIDNGLIRTTEVDSGKRPFFDSYEDFIEKERNIVKEYSIIPEFKISEHLPFYIKNSNGNFRIKNNAFLSIDGAGQNYRSSLVESSDFDDNFAKTFSTSDILKKNEYVRKNDEDITELNKIEIKVRGVKKLLPYNGFYPQERTVQLANLYSDFVDNNLHGGVYNLTYLTGAAEGFVTETQESQTVKSVSSARFGNYYYVAAGMPGLNSNSGGVKIYKSSNSTPRNWSGNAIKTFTTSYADTYASFGQKVRLVAGSNGLNLFIFSHNTASNGAGYQGRGPGYILLSTSPDGNQWTTPQPLQVYNSSPAIYISGALLPQQFDNTYAFGSNFDLLYDNVEQEKLFIVTSDGGESVQLVTGTLENNIWKWSSKIEIDSVTPLTQYEEMGVGVSLVSCSSGYQVFYSSINTTLSGSTYIPNGVIRQKQSIDGGTSWSTSTIIVQGQSPGSGATSRIGSNGMSATSLNNKVYLFFTEPYANISPYNNTGGFYCITSSTGNIWTNYTSQTKNLIYYKQSNYKYTPNLPPQYYYYGPWTTDDMVDSYTDGTHVYYSLSGKNNKQLILGKTDGTTFQVGTEDNSGDLTIYKSSFTNTYWTLNINSSLYSSNTQPILFSTDNNNQNNVSIKYYSLLSDKISTYILQVSGSEKAFKSAALEPFFAPGILYNTIKSGIAVDWPCATGSNTAQLPFGEDTVINAYYPKYFDIYNHQGTNTLQRAYINARSVIDYRVKFESLIYPGEAYKTKKYLENDLISQTTEQSLDENDQLSRFLDGTYIYGGYEPYISPYDFSDINGLGPKQFGVPFVYKKTDSKDDGLYTLAMSNFLAETVKFFLKDEKMLSIVSDPDYKWKYFDSRKTYYMDVVLEKTSDLLMIEAHHTDKHPVGISGEKMNGRYFGYPINITAKDYFAGANFSEEEKKIMHNDPAYGPYTPPYFEGKAIARISFNPPIDRQYTVQEIFQLAKIENIFPDIQESIDTNSDAYIHKMPVLSSVDIFGAVQSVNTVVTENLSAREVAELPDSQTWVISPRMETPVLDFSDQQKVSYTNSYSKTGGFGRGMWSGYGKIPDQSKSIKLKLEYPFPFGNNQETGSLIEQVGFSLNEGRVGTVAETKQISEAIVLIPYLENGGDGTTTLISDSEKKFNFMKIIKTNFKRQKREMEKNADGFKTTTITNMIEKMKKYNIPPNMNFLEYSDIHPFIMYIFEFEHTLDQQDLVDIWQGLMPKISYTSEIEELSISHKSHQDEFFHGKELPENLRWLIFKVKKKAEYDYFNVTFNSKDDSRFDFNKIIGRSLGTDIYSYNWPYDYFSLVEFAKVELSLDYKKK